MLFRNELSLDDCYEMDFVAYGCTYTVDGVNEWVVAAVAHRQPVAHEEQDVDVTVSGKGSKKNIYICADYSAEKIKAQIISRYERKRKILQLIVITYYF